MCDDEDFFDDWDIAMAGLLGEMIADELEEEARAQKDNESLTQEEIWDDESLK